MPSGKRLRYDNGHVTYFTLDGIQQIRHLFWCDYATNTDLTAFQQVENVLPLLRKGIGIHHSGLLPLLKETIEILFGEGLIKVFRKDLIQLYIQLFLMTYASSP